MNVSTLPVKTRTDPQDNSSVGSPADDSDRMDGGHAQCGAKSPTAAGLKQPRRAQFVVKQQGSGCLTVRPLTEKELQEEAILMLKDCMPPAFLSPIKELRKLLNNPVSSGTSNEEYEAAKSALRSAVDAVKQFDRRRGESTFGLQDLKELERALDALWPSIVKLGSVDAKPSIAVASLYELFQAPNLANFFEVPVEYQEAWSRATQSLPVDEATREALVKAASRGGRLVVVSVDDNNIPCAEARDSNDNALDLLGMGMAITFEPEGWLHGYHGGDRTLLCELFASMLKA